MNFVVIVLSLLLPVVVKVGVVSVSSLSAAEYADTEVSTNVCLVVTQELSAGDNRRFFDVSLSLVATPTNNVEIGFGVDIDEDGVLGRCERDFILGWDCGAFECKV